MSGDHVRELLVRSHIARDLLAAAASFRTEEAVVWEYVVNSLQYVERGVVPTVQVRVDKRARLITVTDNARGMSQIGLEHFFTMHAENLERRSGRPGRGKWGTGKSAAFGIANVLRVDTVRDGLRNVVELTRAQIEASDGQEIPVAWIARDEPTGNASGTEITIADINLARIDTEAIIQYIERHLGAFRGVGAQVAVNSHVCEYREPAVAATYEFTPSQRQAELIGDVVLTIKVAQAPLAERDEGIQITAGPGNLVAIERGGMERKEFGSWLFGEIDVPALEEPGQLIEPYDSTRSLQLNQRNPKVMALVGFIGSKLEEVRRILVEQDQEARKSEQSRRLESESDRIANLINSDYQEQQRKLAQIQSATARGGLTGVAGGGTVGSNEPSAWVDGTSAPGTIPKSEPRTKPDNPSEAEPEHGHRHADVVRRGEPDSAGVNPLDPAGGQDGQRRRPRGGFSVKYRNLGNDEDRSRYDMDRKTIYINLDHPAVAAALGVGGVEEPTFRRLSYEIAFTEYAIAIGWEISQLDPDTPADDLLYEIRSSHERVARAAADLYR